MNHIFPTQQIRVINAFRDGIDGPFEIKSQLSRSRELLRQIQANRPLASSLDLM